MTLLILFSFFASFVRLNFGLGCKGFIFLFALLILFEALTVEFAFYSASSSYNVLARVPGKKPNKYYPRICCFSYRDTLKYDAALQ